MSTTTTIGRSYLERGRPVVVLAAYAPPSKARPLPPCPDWLTWRRPPKGAPRNVLIRRASGELVVRPFRRAVPAQVAVRRHAAGEALPAAVVTP